MSNNLIHYIKVVKDINTKNRIIEFPLQTDNTASLSNLKKSFSNSVIGLKYYYKETNYYRYIYPNSDDSDKLYPLSGWDINIIYICLYPEEIEKNITKKNSKNVVNKKQNVEEKYKKQNSEEKKLLQSLIVSRLPMRTTENDLKEYFKNYGKIIYIQIKYVFAYINIHFNSYDCFEKLLNNKNHLINDRNCKIQKITEKCGNFEPIKLYVKMHPKIVDIKILTNYFQKLTKYELIYVYKPYLANKYAFIIFFDGKFAKKLCNKQLPLLEGMKVYVEEEKIINNDDVEENTTNNKNYEIQNKNNNYTFKNKIGNSTNIKEHSILVDGVDIKTTIEKQSTQNKRYIRNNLKNPNKSNYDFPSEDIKDINKKINDSSDKVIININLNREAEQTESKKNNKNNNNNNSNNSGNLTNTVAEDNVSNKIVPLLYVMGIKCLEKIVGFK